MVEKRKDLLEFVLQAEPMKMDSLEKLGGDNERKHVITSLVKEKCKLIYHQSLYKATKLEFEIEIDV